MNYVTPWDLERLLNHFGWRIVDEWSGNDLTGDAMRLDEPELRALQTNAFTWAIISERSTN